MKLYKQLSTGWKRIIIIGWVIWAIIGFPVLWALIGGHEDPVLFLYWPISLIFGYPLLIWIILWINDGFKQSK